MSCLLWCLIQELTPVYSVQFRACMFHVSKLISMCCLPCTDACSLLLMTKLKAVKMQVVSKLPSENFAGYLNFLLKVYTVITRLRFQKSQQQQTIVTSFGFSISLCWGLRYFVEQLVSVENLRSELYKLSYWRFQIFATDSISGAWIVCSVRTGQAGGPVFCFCNHNINYWWLTWQDLTTMTTELLWFVFSNVNFVWVISQWATLVIGSVLFVCGINIRISFLCNENDTFSFSTVSNICLHKSITWYYKECSECKVLHQRLAEFVSRNGKHNAINGRTQLHI